MRRLSLPIGLLVLGVGLWVVGATWSPPYAGAPEPWLSRIQIGLRCGVWVATTLLVMAIVDLAIQARVRRRSGRPAPRLLRDLVAATLVLASASSLAIFIFGAPPTAALTTSGLVVAVVGFAVRSMIADLFYGVTLALERPFEIGDWVGMPDGVVGRVDEFTWRSVKLLTRENLKVIVPNSLLATNQVVNYDQPDPAWRDKLRICLPYGASEAEGRRVLLAAAEQVPEMRELSYQPEARVVEYRPEGVVWELRYWVPSYAQASSATQHLHEALLRGLRFAGLAVPREREEMLVAPLEGERSAERERAARWIDRVAIFAPLPVLERTQLQHQAREIRLEAGAEVVAKDEVGDSLFVIHEGALEVRIDGIEQPVVGVMGAGDVFGEMSLLTGARRSATVVARTAVRVSEITKADVQPLLQRHPELVRELVRVVEQRATADAERDTARSAEASDESERRQFMDRVRAWFRLSEPRGRAPARPEPSAQAPPPEGG